MKYGSKERNCLTYSNWGEYTILQDDPQTIEAWFDQAVEYWKQAIALTPSNYIKAHNWFKITRQFE